ncbi:hypothetical protein CAUPRSCDRAFT_12497 [Caulochytrium protostelioides]|uniref:Uncharacterized protein n=1 Tax=Caulochytrium protostelioides TaxID=1555241 RepID=A0A4P9WRG2_9FUNG|nr:hypothetical protein CAUPRSCDRAFT_12497 [Caulochytrium protostelioides]
MKQRSQRLLKGTPGTSSASGGSAVSALDLDVRSLGKDAVLEMPPAASRLPRPPLPRNSYSDDSATRSAVWYQAQAARATRAASIASQHSRNGCHSPASVVASQHPIHLSATAVATATLATATVATVASSTDDAIDRLLSESDHETSGRRCRDPARRVSKPGLAGDPLFDLLERLPARLADQRAVLPPPRRGAAPLRATLAPTADVLDADDLLRVYESATKDKDKDKDKASSASSRRFSLLSVALSTHRQRSGDVHEPGGRARAPERPRPCGVRVCVHIAVVAAADGDVDGAHVYADDVQCAFVPRARWRAGVTGYVGTRRPRGWLDAR